MSVMERLGYVKREEYERVVRERDRLRLLVAKLEVEKDELMRKIKTLRPPPLTEIKGIGPKAAERLRKARIKDVEDLARASPKKLAKRIGASEKTVLEWIDQAKRLLEY
ncbi:MAG: helix-hairpin-helix domain-containing protein [Candidatus Bathyarchaeia archaeon]